VVGEAALRQTPALPAQRTAGLGAFRCKCGDGGRVSGFRHTCTALAREECKCRCRLRERQHASRLRRLCLPVPAREPDGRQDQQDAHLLCSWGRCHRSRAGFLPRHDAPKLRLRLGRPGCPHREGANPRPHLYSTWHPRRRPAQSRHTCTRSAVPVQVSSPPTARTPSAWRLRSAHVEYDRRKESHGLQPVRPRRPGHTCAGVSVPG